MKNSPSHLMLVYKKELLDIIRDRRTLVSMILVPLLLFPLITIGFSALAVKQQESLESKSYDVGVLHGKNWPVMMERLRESDHLQITDFGHDKAMTDTLLANGDLRAVIEFPEYNSLNDSSSVQLQLLYDKSREQSTIAKSKLIEKLEILRSEETERRLTAFNIPASILNPVEWNLVNVASEEQMLGMILGVMLPYMMIILTMSGGMYPAIDLTAGEKERATLETLLVTPVGRFQIVMGKYLTVMTTSLVTACISLTSMGLVMSYGFTGMMMPDADISFSMNPMHLALAILMMLPMSGLFSSALLTVAVFAKSSREAQSYLTPLFILVILPAMMSMLPGSTLTSKEIWIPVVNIALAMKDILMAQPDVGNILMVILATSLYALAGLFITMKVFQREQVLFKV